MIDSNQLIDKAKSSFERGDYSNALHLYELAIESSPVDLSPYFAAAHIYEHGLSSCGVDLLKAQAYYLKVVELNSDISSVAHLAIARVIFKGGSRSLTSEAVRHCIEAIKINGSAQAHMLLGAIYEYWENRPNDARRQFLLAYKKNMPWGMRFYARSLIRSGNSALGFLAHLWATLIGPFFILRYGEHSPFG